MSDGGRPTKYREEFPDTVYKLALLGLKDTEIAAFLEVSISAYNRWKTERPEFKDSLKRAKEGADAEVAESLYKKAIKGDVTACIFWLKNRHPDKWRDKKDPEGHGEGSSISITFVDAVKNG